MAKRRRLTDNERAQVVAAYVELGNYSAVGRAFGISEGAVRKIVRNSPDSAKLYEQKKAERTADILAHMESRGQAVCGIIDLALDRLSDESKYNRASLQQIATMMGIVIDKFTTATKERMELDGSGKSEARAVAIRADQISGNYADVYRDIIQHNNTEYVFHGGRGSLKSSFVSMIVVQLLINNPNMHALITRKVGNTLRDSVFSQTKWAIAELGLEDQFKSTVSPLQIEYIPTGQIIYFRGADDPMKIKSIKPPFGAIGILWFEELDQFAGENEVRNVEQSAIRGTDTAYILKSFNPPQSLLNWANKFVKVPKKGRYIHKSTYLDAPREWLGQVFIDEAEFLKEINYQAYEHEYLGIPNSAGGLVFPNVQLREITDEEIAGFEYVYQGIDWGYAVDPVDWGRCAYDAKKRTLYLYDEFRALGMSNRELYEVLTEQKGVQPGDLIIADSAEPKSADDLVAYGLNVRRAEKGPDSVRYSIKWLQTLIIVIDPVRCPHTAREFTEYEYEKTKDGEIISQYPDRNNHSIDRTRYALNYIWRKRGQ